MTIEKIDSQSCRLVSGLLETLLFGQLCYRNRGNDAKFRVIILCTLFRVPIRLGKPGKMRVRLENLEIWNFEKFNKYHGKMTSNLEKLGGY